MIQKIKAFRKEVIRKFSQIYADYLIQKMQTELDLEDYDSFYFTLSQAAQLDSYCVLFHEIYLD